MKSAASAVGVPVDLDGFLREWILEGEHATVALKARDGGDAVVDARQGEVDPDILIDSRPTATSGAPRPVAHGALTHVGAVDVELIRRRENVKCGIPLRPRVGLVGEHKIAATRRHSQRLRPRIELRVADSGDDARDSKVVVVACVLVRGLRSSWRKAVSAAVMYSSSAASGSLRSSCSALTISASAFASRRLRGRSGESEGASRSPSNTLRSSRAHMQ